MRCLIGGFIVMVMAALRYEYSVACHLLLIMMND